MNQRSGFNGSLPLTLLAKIETTTHQRWLRRLTPATGADESIRPSNFRKKVEAGLLGVKLIFRLLEYSRIVSAGNRALELFHNPRLGQLDG